MATREELLAEAAKRGLVKSPAAPIPQPQIPRLEQGPRFDPVTRTVNTAVRTVGKFLTKEPSEDLPELREAEQLSGPEGLRTAFGIFAEQDELRRALIVKRARPDSDFEKDEDGNVIVSLQNPGEERQRFFINRPGLSQQDAFDVFFAVASPFLAARGGAKVAPQNVVGRSVGVGAGVGAETGVRDFISGILGSDRRVASPEGIERIGTAVALGAVFELGGQGTFRILKRALQGRQPLTVSQADELRKLGIDPGGLDEATLKQFRGIIGRAKNTQEAIRLAEARGLKVPLTRGEVSQQPRQQAFESATEKGVFGERPQAVLTEFRDQQQQALRGAARETQRRVAGRTVEETGQGASAAQQALRTERDALNRQVGEAFDAARSKGAAFGADDISNLGRDLRRSINSFNPATAPQTFSVVNRIAGFQKQFPGKVTKVSIKALENQRQVLTRVRRSNTPDAAAAGQAVRQIDEFLEEAVERAIVIGDDSAIEALKSARSLRTRLAERFEDNAIIARIIDQQRGQFTASPGQILEELFGGAAFNRRGALGAVKKIKGILSPEQFNVLKEEAFLRLFRNQPGALGEGGSISGAKLRTNFQKIMNDADGRALMRTLFEKQEVEAINRFVRVAQSATDRVPGAVNFSNSTIVARLLSAFPFLNVARGFFPNLQQGARTGQAISATRSPLQTRLPRGTGVPGVAGSELAQ